MYTVDFAQSKKADDFRKNHVCTLPDDPLGGKKIGAIGGQYTWCFTSTGLGVIAIIKCACGAKEDVTDYDNW